MDASAANIQTAIKHSSGDSSLSTLAYRHGTAGTVPTTRCAFIPKSETLMRVMDPEGLAAEGKQFDVVSSLEVIEHVNNPELFINSLSSLVKVPSYLALHS